MGRFIFQLSSNFNHENTEEICQETFLSVVKNLDTFGDRSALRTWIFRIAANTRATTNTSNRWPPSVAAGS